MTGFWLSLLVFLAVFGQLVALLRGLPRLRQLASLPAAAGDDLPAVSIVVSALNEAGTIEPALRSLLALDYPRLQVVAIDDRSTDATGPILDRLATIDSRLRVLHITLLPPGWLGKTHALHAGSQAATGDYLLFTDADVHFDPQVLRRAVAQCESQALDHLVVLPQLHVRESLLAALLLNMQAAFFATLPPWKLRTSRHVYVGLGAFNLVRRAAYQRAGGHEALRLEVVDDLLLGKRLKRSGASQALVLGEGTVSLEWYRSARELARGLEKNAFASVDYSVGKAMAISLLVLLVRVWPMVGLAFTSGAAWWLNAGTVVANLVGQWVILRGTRWPRRALLWWPLSAFVILFILWRGVLVTLRRRGIVWRGTVYPLDELRAFRRGER